MASLVAAVHRNRRPVTALLIAALAFGATVAVSSWPQQQVGAVAAGLPTATPAASAGPSAAPTPAPSRDAVGGGDDPATPPPAGGPLSTILPEPVATEAPRAGPQAVPDALAARLQRRLDKLRARYAIPGVSATVILADGSTWTGTSGMANVKKKTRVKPDTAFALASVSKTYTAALVLALANEGTLDLDARVSALLPKVRIAGKATVRQLLDHTSGLPDYFLHGKIDRALFADRDRAWTSRDVFKYVGKPIFPAGRGWYYSNTNYALLGLVAEAVDGRPLAEQLRSRFFEPLGLDHTWEQVDEEPQGPVAHGYRVTGSTSRPTFTDLSDGTTVVPFTSVVTAAAGAGSVAGTSGDVARWARALYAGEVLPRDTVRAMIADARKTAKFRPKIGYGLGVQVTTLDGRPAIGHSGRLAGFRSVVRYLPSEGITIAVLTNEAKQDPTVIARALLRIVSPPPPEPSPSTR
jgi:D-alanyl-D-alanine carboxypeptidase